MATFLMTLALPDNTGASRMAYQFSKALIEKGHRVLLMHGPIPGNDPQRSVVPALKAARIETVCVPSLAFPISPLLPRQLGALAQKHDVKCVIGVNQRDRAVAMATAKHIGVPGVVCAQNQHTFWGPWPIPAIKQFYYAKSMRTSADLLICTSEPVQDEFVSQFGVAKSKTCVLPNGIDALNFPSYSDAERLGIRQSLGIPESDIMLLNSGRLDEQKGLDILLEAIHKIAPADRKFHIVHVGDVTGGAAKERSIRYRNRLRDIVEKHELQSAVRFIGWRDDVPLLLAASDGYVHSARWEGSPLSVLEAMAAKLPCITPDNTSRPAGFESAIHGFVVTPECSDSLAAAIRKLVDLGPERRKVLGIAAGQLACEKYDIRVIGGQFVKLVERIVSPNDSADSNSTTETKTTAGQIASS